MRIEYIEKIDSSYFVSGWAKSSLFELRNNSKVIKAERYKRGDFEGRFFGFFFEIDEHEIDKTYFVGDGIEEKVSDLIFNKKFLSASETFKVKFQKYIRRVLSKGKSNVKNLLLAKKLHNPISILKAFITSFYDFGYLKEGFFHIKRGVNLEEDIKNEYVIAIPIFNGLEHVKKCLNSIEKFVKDKSFEVWLFNDASTDTKVHKYLDAFCKNNQKFQVFHNKKNLGFVGNCNQVFNKLSRTKKNLILLNSDTEVFESSISNLAKACDQLNGVICPLTNSGSIASFPNPHSDDNKILDKELIERINNVKSEDAFRIPVAVGFCMAVPNIALKKVKGFNEVFGRGYGEEVDFCLRANEFNIYSYLFYGSYVYHYHGASFGKEEKALLNKKNNKIINAIYPTFERLIQGYFSSEILSKNALQTMIKIEEENSLDFAVNQPHGGGATSFLENYSFTNEKSVFAIEPKTQLISQMALYTKYNLMPVLHSYEMDDANKLFIKNFLANDNRKLLINHLISSLQCSNNIHDMLIEYSKDSTYFWHDHFAISPNYTLFHESKKGICYGTKKSVSQESLSTFNAKNLSEWRKNFDSLFNRVDKIIFFSNDSIQHFNKFYSSHNAKTILKPHKLPSVDEVDLNENEKDILEKIQQNSSRFKNKILVLGGVNKAKGSSVITSILNTLKLLDTCIIHVGEIDDRSAFFNSNYISFGRYRKRTLKKLLEEIDFDLGFIPSIWPETFNYTANEIFEYTDSKFCSFDIGAIPERFKNEERYKELDINDFYKEAYPYKVAKSLVDFINN